MKKALLSFFAALAIIISGTFTSSAQSLGDMIGILNQQLPMEMEKGMLLNNLSLNDNVLDINIKITQPVIEGLNASDFQKQLESMSPEEISQLMGAEMMSFFKQMGVSLRLNISFPDGSVTTLPLK